MKFNKISNYWHVEAFLAIPWAAFMTYEVIQIVNHLETIAEAVK